MQQMRLQCGRDETIHLTEEIRKSTETVIVCQISADTMRPASLHETSNRNRRNSQRSAVVYKKTACCYKIIGFCFGKDLLGRQLGYLCHNSKNLCKKFTFHTLKFVYFKNLLYFCTRIRTKYRYSGPNSHVGVHYSLSW